MGQGSTYCWYSVQFRRHPKSNQTPGPPLCRICSVAPSTDKTPNKTRAGVLQFRRRWNVRYLVASVPVARLSIKKYPCAHGSCCPGQLWSVTLNAVSTANVLQLKSQPERRLLFSPTISCGISRIEANEVQVTTVIIMTAVNFVLESDVVLKSTKQPCRWFVSWTLWSHTSVMWGLLLAVKSSLWFSWEYREIRQRFAFFFFSTHNFSKLHKRSFPKHTKMKIVPKVKKKTKNPAQAVASMREHPGLIKRTVRSRFRISFVCIWPDLNHLMWRG